MTLYDIVARQYYDDTGPGSYSWSWLRGTERQTFEVTIAQALERRDAAHLAGAILIDARYFGVELREHANKRAACWPDNGRLESADGIAKQGEGNE